MSAVLDKIRATTPPKTNGLLTRARAHRPLIDPKNTQEITNLLVPKLPAAVQAWVKGLKATKKVYFEGECVDEVPDWKERREAAQAIVQYVVGKPIERTIGVSGSYKELGQVLEELKASPEAVRLLPPEIWGMVPSSPAPGVEEKTR